MNCQWFLCFTKYRFFILFRKLQLSQNCYIYTCTALVGFQHRILQRFKLIMNFCALLLNFLSLHPASLMHENPPKRKIIDGMHASCERERLIVYLQKYTHLCNFCGSYYGSCLTMHISFSLCCALKQQDYMYNLFSFQYTVIQSLESVFRLTIW